jgi:iron-sulfur cluster repair protein YtfE (RIC family)
MSDAEKIKKLEDESKKQREELQKLGRVIDFLLDRFHLKPGQSELEEAIALMSIKGDASALQSFLDRGGKIPSEGARA